MPKYSIGVDFGTLSGRAILVDISNGEEKAQAVYDYQKGVIDEKLPDNKTKLSDDWALQDPKDYLETLKRTIPEVMNTSGIKPEDVIGIGIDFTSCTILPIKADGTPLCFLQEWRQNPHSWVKLWKHHAAQEEATLLNNLAAQNNYAFLKRYGGKISSEWFFPKVMQILKEAPEVYEAADRILEAGDWIVLQLTGSEKRNSCAAGYKALWSKREGYPPREFFKLLDPRLERVVEEKMSRDLYPLGSKAGGLTPKAASWTSLLPGIPVAVANVDAHVAVPAASVTESGRMVIIMGTSNCHMVCSQEERIVPGISGCVEDGIIPGLFGYEAGQSCVGDLFQWFVDTCLPASYRDAALSEGLSLHEYLIHKALMLKPGKSGLLALDWWNGNRSILVDGNLTGLILGMTLNTKPEEIYRALLEATAFGTRKIIETMEEKGVPVREIVAAGGLPGKNKLLMQIYSDVTGRELRVIKTDQSGALGSAIMGAVAAGESLGGYSSISAASKAMAGLRKKTYKPDPDAREIYNTLYKEYSLLHDYFGTGCNEVMHRLKGLKSR